MLQNIFIIIFLSIVFFIIFSSILNLKQIEGMENKQQNNNVVNMTNENAGKIQALRDDMIEIRKIFENLKPLQKDVEINEKVITNLRDADTQKKAEESLNK